MWGNNWKKDFVFMLEDFVIVQMRFRFVHQYPPTGQQICRSEHSLIKYKQIKFLPLDRQQLLWHPRF